MIEIVWTFEESNCETFGNVSCVRFVFVVLVVVVFFYMSMAVKFIRLHLFVVCLHLM